MTISTAQCARLLSLAVHELRTPTSVTAGYVRMVLQFYADALPQEPRKFLSEAAHSAVKLADLLSDLSDLAGLLSGESRLYPEPLALVPMVEQTLEAACGGREFALDLHGRDASTTVLADRERLRQALAAVAHAMTREVPAPERLLADCRVRISRTTCWAVVAIGEPAVAAALAALPFRQWQPFDPWRGGLGFGLPLAAMVVSAHGGRLGAPPGPRPRSAVGVALRCQKPVSPQ